jgi:hypothetical protein
MHPEPPHRCGPPVALLLGAALFGCVDYGVSDDDEEARDSLVVEERFTQHASPAVDVLWVVDNTASMAREQTALAEAFEGFVEALEAEEVAYQLGVITTDVSDEQAGVLQGVPWIITPSHEDPAAAFSEAVQVGIEGAAPEAGLGAAWLALSEPLRSDENRGFRREGSLLHIVVVSDGDDSSQALLEPWLEEDEDVVSFFLGFLEQEAAGGEHATIFSAVAGDTPSGCYGIAGRAQAAHAYHRVVEATDGVFASICAGDMSAVVEGLGAASLVYATRFELLAEPIEGSLRVWVDQERVDSGWVLELDPPALRFDEPPAPAAEIEVRYSVAEETS